jgi:PAS domain S-box-containing protein
MDSAPHPMGIVELTSDGASIVHTHGNNASRHMVELIQRATPDRSLPNAFTLAFAFGCRECERLASPVHFQCEAGGHLLSVSVWRLESTEPGQSRFAYLCSDVSEVAALGREYQRASEASSTFEELRESEEQFRATFETAAIGLAHVMPGGRFLRVNRKFADIVGYPAAELLTKTFAEITHPDDVDADLGRAKALFAGELPTFSMHKRYVRKDGSVVWTNLTASTVRDQVGRVRFGVAAIEDITERKRLEQEREQARQLAESVSRTKDEFLAMLGHELRNPLAPIVTALQLMRLRGAGFEREREVIERQVRHMARLVDDLLDISRITGGRLSLELENVELSRVVTCALETSAPLFENARHEVVIDVPTSGLLVYGDPSRLTQVASNLLANAAKYTPARGRIVVSARREGKEAVLHVMDNGMGIAPNLLGHVFDAFVQAKQTLDRSRGGLGLGLAIVQSLVTLHGGSVSAESEGLNRGSTFTVRLPLASTTIAARTANNRRTPPARGGHARVLVVDDNEDAAEVLASCLETLGYEVRTVHDAPAAIEAAKEFSPDIALIDIGLPVMDGYELARRWREEWGSEDQPYAHLIALTGYGQDKDRERSREAGFSDHLVKPVDLDRLAEILGRLSPSEVRCKVASTAFNDDCA